MNETIMSFFLQAVNIFIHFTGFSIWDWDMVLSCREFGIQSSYVCSPCIYLTWTIFRGMMGNFQTFFLFFLCFIVFCCENFNFCNKVLQHVALQFSLCTHYTYAYPNLLQESAHKAKPKKVCLLLSNVFYIFLKLDSGSYQIYYTYLYQNQNKFH